LCHASLAFVPCLWSSKETELSTASAYPAFSFRKFLTAPFTFAVIIEGYSAGLVAPLQQNQLNG